MANRRAGHIGKQAGVRVACIAAALVVLVGVSSPAGAFRDFAAYNSSATLTWVDAQGRQHVLYSLTDLDEYGMEQGSHTVIARTNPDGSPDLPWGTFGDQHPGVRDVGGSAVAGGVSVADDGTITTFRGATCPGNPAGSSGCIALARYRADGTEVVAPVTLVRPNTISMFRPAAGGDGSLLLLDFESQEVHWVGPDGTDRAARAVGYPSAVLVDSAVDANGSWLVAAKDGTITRQPAGGAIDLTVSAPCSGTDQISIAADDEGGFAVACLVAPGHVEVVRHRADGSIAWQVAGQEASSPFESVDEIAVDAAGRVWVGGRAATCAPGSYYCPIVSQVKGFTADGPGAVAWTGTDSNFVRNTGSSITDLRRTPGGDVAAAMAVDCCYINTIAQNVEGDEVLATVLPARPADDASIGRLYQDLLGRAPTAEERADAAPQVATDGGRAALAASLLDDGPAHAAIEPVARLYRAVFLRDPDRSGLEYWVRQRGNGMALGTVAKRFAASNEFQRRYHGTSNRAFVEAVYRNVFSRDGDPTGTAFWTKRIDTRRATRAQVVLQFSESTEGVRRARPVVEPLAASLLLLGRLPSLSERTAWSTFAEPHRDAAAAILPSYDYRIRPFA